MSLDQLSSLNSSADFHSDAVSTNRDYAEKGSFTVHDHSFALHTSKHSVPFDVSSTWMPNLHFSANDTFIARVDGSAPSSGNKIGMILGTAFGILALVGVLFSIWFVMARNQPREEGWETERDDGRDLEFDFETASDSMDWAVQSGSGEERSGHHDQDMGDFMGAGATFAEIFAWNTGEGINAIYPPLGTTSGLR
jgi:hypothetical protein